MLGVALTTAALAGCSSTSSSPQAVGQPSSTVPTTSTAAAGTDATTSPAKSSVSSLLASWGTSGKISTKAMPTADPAWIARLQPGEDNSHVDIVIDPGTLNLVALVDEAAREGDVSALVRLSNESESATDFSRPGLLAGLVTLLEKTHPAATDGITYPGFTMTGGPSGKTETEDAAALGLGAGAKYTGVTTYFRSATGPGSDGSTEWTGAHFAS